ncbi:MAG: hypothetical protein RLZZ420_958 [Bacteroidota bacterium]|jgi:putative colanic acid biosynthesis UDP-glucose lipid carrier transferase
MNREYFKSLQAFLILVDLLLINVALATAFTLNGSVLAGKNTLLLVAVMFIHTAWFIFYFISGTYSRNSINKFNVFIKQTLKSSLYLCLFLFFTLFVSPYTQLLIFPLLHFILLFVPFLFLSRILFYYGRKYFSQNNDLITNVAILGYNDTARKLADYLEDDLINTRLVGYFANNHCVTELTNYPILSDLSAAIQTASTHQVQEIYSTISPEEDKEIYNLMLESEKFCIRFKFVPSLNTFYKKPFHTQFYNDLPILSPFPDPLDDPGNRFKKRVFDITIAFFVVIFILSWLLPLLSLVIYLESGAPIFFLQKRTGKSDKPFNCFKFRTMHLTPDKEHVQAKKHDVRVTRVGSLLRKTSLDEFPQFINVLLGQMSVVGPRPHMISHTKEFSQLVDHYMVRQLLKPGITGWAQVNGYRGEITHPDQLKMRVSNDLWYLENWSVWLDFRIIFLTATGIFRGDKHAY